MSINTFHKVITSENEFSQLLVNLTNGNEALRKIIKKFFFGDDAELYIKFLDTQKRDKNGQPDIHFFLQGKNDVIIGEAIIEVKTQNSHLTENQPEGYANKLLQNVSGDKYLFFLIPKYYEHEHEIKNRFDSMKVQGLIHFKIRYWNDFIKILRNEMNCIEGSFLNEIIEHINDKFGFNNIKFTSQELNNMKTNEIPSLLYKLKHLIDSVAKQLNYREIKWYNAIDQGGGSYGEGYGFHYKDEAFWFGYDLDLWNSKNASLIIFVNRNNPQAFEAFDTHFGEGVIILDVDSKYLDLTNDLSFEENNVETIVEKIRSFSSKLSKPLHLQLTT